MMLHIIYITKPTRSGNIITQHEINMNKICPKYVTPCPRAQPARVLGLLITTESLIWLKKSHIFSRKFLPCQTTLINRRKTDVESDNLKVALKQTTFLLT